MIISQTIMVNNQTKRPFCRHIVETAHTLKSARARQKQRRQLGGEFVNGWYVLRLPEWTEYQRYLVSSS